MMTDPHVRKPPYRCSILLNGSFTEFDLLHLHLGPEEDLKVLVSRIFGKFSSFRSTVSLVRRISKRIFVGEKNDFIALYCRAK